MLRQTVISPRGQTPAISISRHNTFIVFVDVKHTYTVCMFPMPTYSVSMIRMGLEVSEGLKTWRERPLLVGGSTVCVSPQGKKICKVMNQRTPMLWLLLFTQTKTEMEIKNTLIFKITVDHSLA